MVRRWPVDDAVSYCNIDDEVADHPDDPLESITRGPYHNDGDFYAPEYIPLTEFTLDVGASFSHVFGAHSLTAFEFPVSPADPLPQRDPPFGADDDDDASPGDDDSSPATEDGCSCGVDAPRKGGWAVALIAAGSWFLRCRRRGGFPATEPQQ